jgi:2'-5' RNA ligase
MRAFLAFEVSAPVKEYLQGIIRGMASRITGVKWVKSDGQHITLKFFSEIEETMANNMKERLARIENMYGPFEATAMGVDAFPNKRRARVIVVNLEKGVDIAKAIFHDIEDALSTLGRRKEPAPLLERDIPGLEEMSFIVERLVLFMSTLTPQGAIYTPVWEIGFKGEERK